MYNIYTIYMYIQYICIIYFKWNSVPYGCQTEVSFPCWLSAEESFQLLKTNHSLSQGPLPVLAI